MVKCTIRVNAGLIEQSGPPMRTTSRPRKLTLISGHILGYTLELVPEKLALIAEQTLQTEPTVLTHAKLHKHNKCFVNKEKRN